MNASDPLSLDQIQRWMQAVITHPLGVEAGLDAAEADLHVPADAVEDVVTRSRTLPGVDRLRVYANAYYARLFEVLAAEFPAVAHSVGDDVFHQFALGYLQQHPSQSYTLADLGREFPAHLEQTRPPRDGDASEPDWADFVVDLARLERLYSEVFDGPGVEGQTLLSAADLSPISPESWPLTRLQTVPCLRLLALRFPAHEYVSAVRRGADATSPAPGPTWLVITRRDYVVRRVAVSQPEFAALAALHRGEAVGEAISAAGARFPGSDDEFAARLQQWFQNWTTAGYFQGLRLESDAPPADSRDS